MIGSIVAFLLIFFVCVGLGAARPYGLFRTDKGGLIMAARKELKAGELVLEDKDPLLHFSCLARDSDLETDAMKATSCFNAFMQLSPSQSKRVLALFNRPTSAKWAEEMSVFASRIIDLKSCEMFGRVAKVMRLNAFDMGGGDFGIYDQPVGLFAHSCDPNCVYSFEGKSIHFRALRPIQAHEPLTISYCSARDIDATHLRRQYYLNHKDFTCHCPRCDALGDDTRQFDCFDPFCNGVMMAHQPINKMCAEVSGLRYTDVNYTEPRLLPCTVCHRTPPISYEARMLQLESKLPDLIDYFSRAVLVYQNSSHQLVQLVREINSYNLPVRHAAAVPVLCVQMHALSALHQHSDTAEVCEQLRSAILQYLAAHEAVLPGIHPLRCRAAFMVSTLCLNAFRKLRSPLSLRETKSLLQQGLREHLIIHGREHCSAYMDAILVGVLQLLPPPSFSSQLSLPQATERCAFCEESPLQAAMKRTRCGDCRKVMYCSAGCQRAHWKLHKSGCSGK